MSSFVKYLDFLRESDLSQNFKPKMTPHWQAHLQVAIVSSKPFSVYPVERSISLNERLPFCDSRKAAYSTHGESLSV